jgi:hypothetical protein
VKRSSRKVKLSIPTENIKENSKENSNGNSNETLTESLNETVKGNSKESRKSDDPKEPQGLIENISSMVSRSLHFFNFNKFGKRSLGKFNKNGLEKIRFVLSFLGNCHSIN